MADAPAPPITQAQFNGIVADDAAKNTVPVHTFDLDATPTEKAASAGQGKDKLKSVTADEHPAGGKEVPVDTGGAAVVPTITIEDVDKVAADEDEEPVSPGQPPGAMPRSPAPVIPDWYKVGWRAASGIDEQVTAEGEEKDKHILDIFMKEQYYGDWYHNAALIIAVVIVTHFMTAFHFGWGWLFIVLAFASTYYSTSLGRFKRRARDDIQRELVKTRLVNTHESADWINNFLDRFWLIYEPVLSQTIVSSVEQVLTTNCPPFLDSLRMTTFTLGTKAPRIEQVKTYPDTEDDVIMMDWGISFTPNDVSDLTTRQIKSKMNPKIVLSVRVGKGIAAAAMPILVEDMTFSGLMRVRIKLMTNFPHVQVVDLSFMEKPVIDYVLKPIGGETFGFDIANVPGLSAFIRNMVHGTLAPMMYDPNFFTLNIEQMLSGEPLDSAIGVLQVTLHSCRGLRATKIPGNTPDPYVSLSINQRSELARTKYKHNTSNPTWMETKFIIINSLNESLIMSVFDYNDHRKNSELGFATFEMARLKEDATHEGVELPVLKDGKERGNIRFDVSFFPVLKPDVTGTEELPETNVGIVRLTIHQAKDLDSSKSMSGDLNPLAKIYLGSNPTAIHKTVRFKHTNNPVWESATEFLCSDRASSVITIKVIDDREILKDPVVGYMRVRLEDLLEAKKEAGRDWWPLSGCKGGGKVRVSTEWKPLNMAGSLHGADQYVPPIGVVRLWLKKAQDVKNVEATLGGKSDPYVRVQVNNVTQGRTEVVNNNLSPEWDQIIYVPVHSLKEAMMLEVMDYQHLTKDRSLGWVELKVSDLAHAAEDKTSAYISNGKRIGEDNIRLDKGTFKGKLFYEAEFVPSIRINNIKFNTAGNALQRVAQGANGDAGGDDVSDGNSFSSSDEEAQAVPDGLTVISAVPNDASEETAETTPKPQHKKAKSTDTTNTTKTTGTVESNMTRTTSKSAVSETLLNGSIVAEPKEEVLPELTKEELLRYQSGIIVFNVIGGQLHKKARLEVLLDEAYWPAFSTVRARSTHAQWEYIGEGFMKELDFGRVWLRLNEADEGDKDDVIAEFRGDAKVFLQQTLDGPAQFTLTHRDDEDKVSMVEIEARYLPVPIVLEPRESVNNQGVVRVDLLYGREIHAADRGGKSDPFVVFQLNGQKVYKSQTKKKTVSPDWNENFDFQVPSRFNADFQLEVFDWNQIEQAKSLGSARVDLSALEPFEALELDVKLSHQKHGEKGYVRVRLLFQPEIIAKTRKNTSTFSTAGRAMTQIGHLPMGAGKGVIHGVTGVFRRGNGSDSDDDTRALEKATARSVKELPAGQASQVGGPGASLAPAAAFAPMPVNMGAVPNGSGSIHGPSTEPGTLRVTVLDAKDLSTSDVKPYVVLRLGDKEFKTKHQKSATPEWNDVFAFVAGPSQPKLYVWINDYKTLGKDKTLGSAEVEIWRHIQPGVSSVTEIVAELREGQGQLRLKFDYDATPNPSVRQRGSRASISSVDSRGPSISSPSRFSLSRKRGTDKDD